MVKPVLVADAHSKLFPERQIPGPIIVSIGVMGGLLLLWAFSLPLLGEIRQSVQVFVAEINVVMAAELGKALMEHLVRWADEYLTINLPRLLQL